MAEIDAGRPVAIIFPGSQEGRASQDGTLFLPNTASMIRGCPNPEGARKLIDFLLSPEVEAKLARSKSRQIPVNPNVKAELPAAMATPQTVPSLPVDFGQAAELWEEVQVFLIRKFAE
jgi:iron(III) transport system substrate-binding protein